MDFLHLDYFAVSPKEGGGFLVAAIIALSWWPSHYIFKWLRKNHRSNSVLRQSIIGCSILSLFLIILGFYLAKHNPGYGSAGSEFIWVPFILLALGIWSGFLSGYIKMKIS